MPTNFFSSYNLCFCYKEKELTLLHMPFFYLKLFRRTYKKIVSIFTTSHSNPYLLKKINKKKVSPGCRFTSLTRNGMKYPIISSAEVFSLTFFWNQFQQPICGRVQYKGQLIFFRFVTI